MTAIPFPAPAPPPVRPRRFRARHALLALLAVFTVFVLALVLSFRVGSEIRTLRHATLTATPDTWERKFEFGIGRLPVWLAQAGLSFVPLEPEARAAVDALRSADVALYQKRPGSPDPDPNTLLTNVQTAMEKDGWEPVVIVHDGRETVAIFIPTRPAPVDSAVRATLLVLDGSDLVMASVRADLAPILDAVLASDRLPMLAHR
jgi:hypothetical protein